MLARLVPGDGAVAHSQCAVCFVVDTPTGATSNTVGLVATDSAVAQSQRASVVDTTPASVAATGCNVAAEDAVAHTQHAGVEDAPTIAGPPPADGELAERSGHLISDAQNPRRVVALDEGGRLPCPMDRDAALICQYQCTQLQRVGTLWHSNLDIASQGERVRLLNGSPQGTLAVLVRACPSPRWASWVSLVVLTVNWYVFAVVSERPQEKMISPG